MRSKERVLVAVNLQQADRVPMDYHGNPFVLERLQKDLKVETHLELLKRLGSDIVDLRGTVDPIYCGPVPYSQAISATKKESFWGWRQETREAASGPEEMYVDFPLSHAQTIAELRANPLLGESTRTPENVASARH